ncbi:MULTISPECIES: flagellar biosynthesis anti-sigma factor FlgM [unclassified Mesobacillus]|uniref:flagellar biosynthesis anti-sigma factor FlgM n=1 Tax=unclassified Mesobacillus TaxID=2675270 RepID=UPI00203C5EBD|nr:MULTISPECIES: flagellar biosynthesis anti-sigma factor FlgM [unclassified Mesobacillus]MCM3124135.1 flagellar biosynthesis anti-sigma factor FlgM [Mesobacillus sp. MER 33]MCM3233984.1 flagellar biosynthesis anti-sigma factor FlgM [Mesobacillus sp. MER 48]
MKINNNFGPSGINPYKRQMNKLDAAATAQNKKADKVEISTTAKEMQQLSQVSVERKQKVEELKIQVENGTYKVDSKETAKSIINFYRNK